MIECNGCDTTWTATGVHHCGACHISMSSLGAFDAHRTGSFTESGEKIIPKGKAEPKGPRRCLPPAEAGLIDANRKYPCWTVPGDGTEWWKESEEE